MCWENWDFTVSERPLQLSTEQNICLLQTYKFNTLNAQLKIKNYLQIDFSGTSQILQLGWLYQYIDLNLPQVEVEGKTGDKIFWTVSCFTDVNIRDCAATKSD